MYGSWMALVRIHNIYLQYSQPATRGQCGPLSLCLGQAACVDPSVCGLGGLSQMLYLYFMSVCVLDKRVWALSGSLCCNFLSGTQKPNIQALRLLCSGRATWVCALRRRSQWGRKEMERQKQKLVEVLRQRITPNNCNCTVVVEVVNSFCDSFTLLFLLHSQTFNCLHIFICFLILSPVWH